MYSENAKMQTQELSKVGLKLIDGDIFNRSFIGEIKDIIRVDGEIVDIKEGHNIIINDIGKLVACLFKSQSGYSGLGYWAIGQGADNWDDVTPPSPVATDTKLTSEIGRKVIPTSAITFLDDDGVITTSVTNKIQIDITFTESECNGKWREFGIVGGNASATLNSGIFINHKTHGLIVKTSNMTIQRIMKFTFN